MIKSNIALFKVYISESAKKALRNTLDSDYIAQGPKVDEFEYDLSRYLGCNYPVTVNSGTSALHLALRLCDLSINDEVISTPLTCTATNIPILANSAKIVWADIDNDLMISPNSIESRITKNTKAIMCVSWGGFTPNLSRIVEIAHKYNLKIIHDAAHAFGSKYKNRYVGSGNDNIDFTCFSFQAIKTLTTGDGGLLVSNNENCYHRAKRLRWFGIDRDNTKAMYRCEAPIIEWGYKFHMNDIAATIGIENLKSIDVNLVIAEENTQYYNSNLSNLDGINLINWNPDCLSSNWLFTVLVDRQQDFIKYMNQCNIITSKVHEQNTKHPCFGTANNISLPNLEKLVNKMVCIPNGWWVSPENREYIVDCIKKGW